MATILGGDFDRLRNDLQSESMQNEIADFIEKEIRPLNEFSVYHTLCTWAELHVDTFNEENVIRLFDELNVVIEKCPPGHDRGHIVRDILAGIVLALNDPFIKDARFASEIWAGIMAAAFHDIGNSIVFRYHDRKNKCGHGEIGAWLFFQIANEIDPKHEKIYLLAAHAIAAHTHYLKPIEVENPKGYVRETYEDTIMNSGHPIRIAMHMARFADRLDCNGSTLLARHILAACDSYHVEGAQDFSAGKFFKLNEEYLHALLVPESRNISGKPTALKHVSNFSDSNFGNSPYSKNDYRFPFFSLLMAWKVNEANTILSIAESNKQDLTRHAAIYEVLRIISGSKIPDNVSGVLEQSWNSLNEEQKLKWVSILYYVKRNYIEWCHLLLCFIPKSSGFYKFALDISTRVF